MGDNGRFPHARRRTPAAAGWPPIAIIPVAVLLLSTGACEEETSSPALRLIIDIEPDVEVPDVVDNVVVSITAARDEAGPTCQPLTRVFELSSGESLPLRVAYIVGSEYRRWIAFRVIWRSGTTELLQRTLLLPWSEAGGVREARTTLEVSCLTLPEPCPAGQQCVAGVCDLVPGTRDPFDAALSTGEPSCEADGDGAGP